MVKIENEPAPDWPEGAFVKEEPWAKEEETLPTWPEGAIVKYEIGEEEPPVWPEGAVVKQEQQEEQEQYAQHELHALQAKPGQPEEVMPAQRCGGHGCELPRFHDGLCTSQQVVGPRQRRPPTHMLAGQSLQLMHLRELGRGLAKGTQRKRAANSDGVEIEEVQNEATPARRCGGPGCELAGSHKA
eukprot:scaffold74656_cov57-Phaeocystis_antarctica.AAC.3